MIRRSPKILSTSLDGDFLMMDLDRGKICTLNGVASRIWELLDNPLEPEAILAQLIAEYDVPTAICEQEVWKFLEQLRNRGMLVDVGSSAATPSSRPDSPSL